MFRELHCKGRSQAVLAGIWLTLLGGACIHFGLATPGVPSPIARSAAIGSPLIVWQVPCTNSLATEASEGGIGRVRELEDGSRIVRVAPGEPVQVALLTAGFTAVGQPDLSFDGKRILFVGTANEESADAIWELSLDTLHVRRVVECPAACDRAIYLSTLYELDAPAPLDQIVLRAESRESGAPELFRCRMDGGDLQQITFAPGGADNPLLLRDGRLIFSSAVPAASDAQESGTIFLSINFDGTDVFPFTGQDGPAGIRTGPIQTEDEHVAFLEKSDRLRLVSVRAARSLRSRSVLVDDFGDVASISALSDSRFLVARREKGAAGEYGISLLDIKTGATSALFDSPEYSELSAIEAVPRPMPVGRSTVVDASVGIGQLYCLNAYLSGTSSTADGRAIARIRAYADATPGQGSAPRLLGELEIESDGSFFAELPARMPIQLETLDAEGHTLQRMRSWFWVMPKERRGCVGCHEDRELAPPNSHVFALRKGPQRLGGTNAPALQKEE